MSTNLTYPVSPFLPFTKIVSADMNAQLAAIKSRLNWSGGTDTATGLSDDNIQSNVVSGGGLTRNTKLKAGTANYVVINDVNGKMTEEASLALSRGGLGASFSNLTGQGGLGIIVNNAETALTFGAPTVGSLVESLAGTITSLTAGEAIAANDAVCLDLGLDSSSNNIYRVFKADYTKANRRNNLLGMAQALATVTAGVYSWVASANFVTSNVITYTINGRPYSTNFTTDNATTLQAIATQMATDPDVNGAVSDAVHTITVTGRGALFININSSTVTGGASQATIIVTTTTAPVGQNVKIQCFGLLTGQTALTTGMVYYLGTAGAITSTPADPAPIQVGQALSTTSIFINKNSLNFQFGTPSVYVRTGGSTDGNALSSGTSGVADGEHFNFTSWSSSTAMPAVRYMASGGDCAYSNLHHSVSGSATGNFIDAVTYSYNKSTWATLSNKPTAVIWLTVSAFNGFLYGNCGATTNAASNRTAKAEKWNTTSWAAGTDWAFSLYTHINFIANSLLTTTGGLVASGVSNSVSSARNTSDTLSTPASAPIAGTGSGGSTLNGIGLTLNFNAGTSNTVAYTFNGTAWSTALTCAIANIGEKGAGSATSVARALQFSNAGQTSGTSTPIATSQSYNGTSFASSTSSANSRGDRPSASVI